MKRKNVYLHRMGNKAKFSFRHSADLVGRFELREHDEIKTWCWMPEPGMGRKPTSEWLYRNCPQAV